VQGNPINVRNILAFTLNLVAGFGNPAEHDGFVTYLEIYIKLQDNCEAISGFSLFEENISVLVKGIKK
jgi:hypothetical protein